MNTDNHLSPQSPRTSGDQQGADEVDDSDKKKRLALALINQGKSQEAEMIYRELIKRGSTDSGIYCNLAALCGQDGRHGESIDHLQTALSLNPDCALTHYNLGKALQRHGDPVSALESYSRAAEIRPDLPEVYYHLGHALMGQGRVDAAINAYRREIQRKPQHIGAHYNLGNALKQQGCTGAAIRAYQRVLELNDGYPAAHFRLGVCLQDSGDLNAAITSYMKAIQLKPDHVQSHFNLGNALYEQGDLSAAIDVYRKAGLLNPGFAEAHNNLAKSLMEDGQISAAIESLDAALQIMPNNADIKANLSQCLLLAENYKAGWECYEWRHQRSKPSLPHATPKCRRWSGTSLADGDKILVVSEQGLGDTLQFMRYVTALKNMGIEATICAQEKLHGLIQASGIDADPLTPEQANDRTDGCWVPLLSLPGYLDVNPANPLIADPYIKTSAELVVRWEGLLSAERRPIIAINWQGNPSYEQKSSLSRSLPLEAFAPIAAKTNATLLSLQKGFGSEQLETCSFSDRFVSCQERINQIWDFLDTAAIIANCDLVITSDTSVAHLAGGMGKATWLLLKRVPDWRWALDKETTFWYPSMRLFRQHERGNWDDVLDRVTEALLQECPGAGST